MLYKRLALLFFAFTVPAVKMDAQKEYTLSGTISDSIDGETVIGSVIYIKSLSKGTSTNAYGFYSLTLPEGICDVSYSFIGYITTVKTIRLDKNTSINMKLRPSGGSLKEVVISSETDADREDVKSSQMGLIKLSMDQIKHVPCIGGEVDLIKVLQLLPGIKRGSEGQTGMYVRGGDADQNLIMVDEATIYNVSHLFGFFSVFNNDALKDVNMYKGGFPASYGGRLSSVMDIHMKEGDMEHFHVDGGIGILSSHLTIQGPIKKDTSSFIISGRRSYIDELFRLIYGKNVLPYYFYDVNAKLNYKLSDKDHLYLSSYFGDDVLSYNESSNASPLDFGFVLGNLTGTLRWNHVYKENKLFSNVSLIYTRFRYNVYGDFAGNSILIKSSIQDIGLKADYNYYKSSWNKFFFGASLINHDFKPNVVSTSGLISENLQSEQGPVLLSQEGALYALNDRKLSDHWSINYGLRLSGIITQGTGYVNLEPRISVVRVLSETTSIKLGFSRMAQYMHLVSSSSIALPTDLWYPVTKNVAPETANQLDLSFTKLFEKRKLKFVTELYTKSMQNLIDFKDGSNLILNNNFESDLVIGKGNASGIEFFLNKTAGRFNGWAGYTLSVSTRQFADLNQGQVFYSPYDRRNDWSVVLNYDIIKRLSVSVVWVYSTGQRFTPMVGNYFMPNASITSVNILPIYAERNSVVLPPSTRLDINFVVKSREHKHFKSEWTIGAYNVLNRAQPYEVQIVSTGNGTYQYQAIGLFGFIPSVGYNFNF